MLIQRKSIDENVLRASSYKKEALDNFRQYKNEKNILYLQWAKDSLKYYKINVNKIKEIQSIDYDWYESKVIELFELYFPGRYDVQDNCILLHFPEVLITNTNGKEHIGTDYYFEFQFSGIEKESICLEVIRMSATPEELQSNYAHSHIGCPALTYWTGAICFGDEFKWNRFELLIALEMLLSNLQVFMETESTNTSPYSLISKIGFFNNRIKSNDAYEIEDISKIDFDLTTEFEKDYVYILPVDNERLNLYLIENYTSKALCYSHNDEYYRDCAGEITEQSSNNNKFIFKGEEITFKILPTRHVIPEKVINPYFKQHFIKYAKSEITKKLAASTAPEPKLVVNNKRKSVQKNTVPVLQN